MLPRLQRERGDAARLVALDTVCGKDRRDVARIGGLRRAGALPSLEIAAHGRGRPGLGLRVACGGKCIQKIVAADNPTQLSDPGEAIVDPAPVDHAVVFADDERFGQRDGLEARRQIARGVEQHGHAQAVVIAQLAGVRPRTTGVGQDQVEIDAGGLRGLGEAVHLAQVACRDRAIAVDEDQCRWSCAVLVAKPADIAIDIQEPRTDDLREPFLQRPGLGDVRGPVVCGEPGDWEEQRRA